MYIYLYVYLFVFLISISIFEVWREQNWDGFHFERIYTTTVEKHQWLVNSSHYYNFLQYKNFYWPSAGTYIFYYKNLLYGRIFFFLTLEHYWLTN